MTRVRLIPLFASALCLAAPATAWAEEDTATYRAQGEEALERLKAETAPRTRARNVIVFIGDGMGVSTITAARIFAGQAMGRDGESSQTAMDGLGHTALVKTYSQNAQVSDSASTATASMAGVKTHASVLGIGPEAQIDDCELGKNHHVPSLIALAQERDIATGVVTTTGITHATPAAGYAHSVQRDWESDADMPEEAKKQGCLDITRQLVEGQTGSRIDVILGGGRAKFLPKTAADPEHAEKRGERADKPNLVALWKRRNPKDLFAWNREQFASFDPARHTRLFGLFEPGHMNFEADRANDLGGEPSLAEMTETAIRALSHTDKGFVLLVEGGRIDHAHHMGNAYRALVDARAMDDAVATALAMTGRDDTLILATADHSHTLTINSYPALGNPILASVTTESGEPVRAKDGKAYTTLSYANGPGAVHDHARSDPAEADTFELNYRQQALVLPSCETHAGEDVVVRASGPGAQWLRGTIEQHTIFYVMRQALFGPQGQ